MSAHLAHSRPLLVRTTRFCVLAFVAICLAIRPSVASDGIAEPMGQVAPRELRCAVLQIRQARLQEGLAVFELEDLLNDADLAGEAYGKAKQHIMASMDLIDQAQDALQDLLDGPTARLYPLNFFEIGIGRADEIRSLDQRALDGLDVLVRRREARKLIDILEAAIHVKDVTVNFLVSAQDPATSPRLRVSSNDPVDFRPDQGIQYTFDTGSVSRTGLHPRELTFSATRTARNQHPAPVLRTAPEAPAKRVRRVNRYLSFRGKKKTADGLAYHVAPNALIGPYDVEFSAGLFRKARKKHSPDARVTVEFDVLGIDPLDFFVVSTRYVPADDETPSGVQIFAGSTGGVARGDLFLPGAIAADVRVVFENGRFDVFARPLGGGEEDYTPVGSWQHGDAGELWTLGVGASRLRKGTELGIDDLVLTPR